MARSMPVDNVKIYRYKLTTTGVHSRDGWGSKAGESYEEVRAIGPYSTKVALSHWRRPGSKLKIELQQLDSNAITCELEWVTLKVTIQEDEE